MPHSSTGPIQVSYLFDPLCGWCYGAAPVIETLSRHPGVAVTLVPTGLFAGQGARTMSPALAQYAWENDQRIAELSGQTFSDSYRRHVLGASGTPFDSGPATLALMAARLSEPGSEHSVLKTLQEARYMEGRDIVTRAGVREILMARGFTRVLRELDMAFEDVETLAQETLNTGRRLMAQTGTRGIPALVARSHAGTRLFDNAIIMGGIDALLSALSTSTTSESDQGKGVFP